jgi:hypothetical protein
MSLRKLVLGPSSELTLQMVERLLNNAVQGSALTILIRHGAHDTAGITAEACREVHERVAASRGSSSTPHLTAQKV